MLRTHGRSFWALVDQGIISAGGFISSLLLARTLSTTDYGAYAIIFSLIIASSIVPNALIGFPLLSQIPILQPLDRVEISRRAIAMTITWGMLAGLLITAVVQNAHWAGGLSGLYVLAAVLLSQAHLTTRNILIASSRFVEATRSDTARWVAQIILLLLLMKSGDLDVTTALGSIALASFLGVAMQLRQTGINQVKFGELANFWGFFWLHGKWVFAGALVTTLFSQAIILGVAAGSGEAGVANYQAALTILGIINPILISLGNVLVPVVSKANDSDGTRAAMWQTVRSSIPFVAIFAVTLSLVSLFPRQILSAAYGDTSRYADLAWEVRVLSIGHVFVLIAGICGAYLNAIGRSVFSLIGQIAGAVVVICVGVPLAVHFGVRGAMAGSSISYFVWSLVLVVFVALTSGCKERQVAPASYVR